MHVHYNGLGVEIHPTLYILTAIEVCKSLTLVTCWLHHHPVFPDHWLVYSLNIALLIYLMREGIQTHLIEKVS